MNKKIIEIFNPVLSDVDAEACIVSTKHGDVIIIFKEDDVYESHLASIDSEELFKELFSIYHLGVVFSDGPCRWGKLSEEEIENDKRRQIALMQELFSAIWPDKEVPDVTWDPNLMRLAL